MLTLLGRGLAFTPPSSRAFDELGEAWRAFAGAPSAHLSVHAQWRAARSGPSVALRQRPLPRVERDAGGALTLEGEDFSARISADLGRIDLEGPDHSAIVQDALRIWLAESVRRAGGIVVHGVCLAHGGRAALFTGQSGAGKSTLGGLWREAGGVVLADELVALLPGEEDVTAWGTPWNVGTPGTATLSLLGTLAWDARHTVRPQPPSAVLRTLASNLLLSDTSPAGKAEALRNASRLLARVHTVELAFALDTGVAPVVREALERP